MSNISKRVFRGTFWLTSSRFFHLFLTCVTTVFIARWLGPDDYGYIPLVASIVSISMIFADAGIAPSTARFLAEIQEDRQGTWFALKRILKLRIFLVVPVCFGLYLSIYWLSIFLSAPVKAK